MATPLTLKVSDELLSALDAAAEVAGTPRATLARAAMEVGLELMPPIKWFAIVRFRPVAECPAMWRPMAAELAGQDFQVQGVARTPTAGPCLVLQPHPCADVFPRFYLAPADVLQLSEE